MPTKTKSNKERVQPITIKGATLIYKNFAGLAKRFNAKGIRNFHVVLDSEFAQVLERDGWNIKWHDPREDSDDPAWPSIKVAVRFDNYPPRIMLITKGGKTLLDEESVDILDWAEIVRADIVLTGSRWDVQGKQGIKAYLAKGFITLSDDDLESEYSDVKSSLNSRVSDDDED